LRIASASLVFCALTPAARAYFHPPIYIGNRRAISSPPIAMATAMANKQSRTVTALDHAQPVIVADRDGSQGQNGRNQED